MRGSIVTIAVPLLLALNGQAAAAEESDLEAVLQFEEVGEELRGWGGGPPETLHFDDVVVHSGHGAARLERSSDSPREFSTITKRLPVDFDGEWIELRGYLRTDGVSEFAGLWLRQDGPGGVLQFDNMRDRGVRGTTEWTEYAVRLPLDQEARELYFGVLLVGTGKAWTDDLVLLVDGKPIRQASRRREAPGGDQESDVDSGITVSSLTETQVENVAVLGTVWGFLKYHHPRVAAGELQWDFELFRVLPDILDATDPEARNHRLVQWVDELGVPESCDPCAMPPENAQLLPRLDWIDDAERLGTALARRLRDIHAHRYSGVEQHYVSQVPRVRNPVFDNELDYPSQRPPDAGYRILSLLRLWNIIEYWFPYRDLLDEDWQAVLREFLPRLVAADSWDAYRLELLAFTTRIHDTHANLFAELDVRPPRGRCGWPVAVRFIEGRATVTTMNESTEREASGLELGDVIETVDGRPVDSLIEAWSPYYSASNEASRMRDIARSLPRGDCGRSILTIERQGDTRQLTVHRTTDGAPRVRTHDQPGETFQLLSPEVGYLKLSTVRVREIPQYLELAAGTRGLVIDIRNYPSEFVVFALGGRLVDTKTPFARFTVGDLSNPGAFVWTPPVELEPIRPHYEGKVAILVDEASFSQAEYTAMALRAGPNAVVIGSTTSGADGNVSKIPLPGGIHATISGIGVFYPDETPTQRVGIFPDIFVAPTIEGIRDGRDEVLEAALRHILGSQADPETVRGMAGRL